jgi:protocatechuate 3,4-dioxygenase beta subunit
MRFSRRGFVERALSLCLVPVWARALEDRDAQPLARVSHFPQMLTGGVGVTPCGSLAPPATVPAFGRVAATDEPGEPLRITGTIYNPDAVTPARDVVLFLYHTDVHGHYNQPNSPFNPRIYGWVKSDANGRYGFDTIKPAPYPELNTPAHIHVNIFGPGFPEYWVDDYWFEADPLITPRQLTTLTGRGGSPSIVKLTLDGDGVLQGMRDFTLQHGFAAGRCHLLTYRPFRAS